MQKELDKWSEQARFVQLIIDGKLVVSKKKKTALVAELKAKNFKTFEKHVEAIKEGELEPIVEENEEAEENAKIGASGYDYLLGMPIWSLTQERVEKLMRQIGDKEHEIDTLIKLTKEDLWRADLDEFIKEWRFQLQDEADRRKEARKLGRRESRKLKTGTSAAAARKRKAYGEEDSDFEAGGRAKKTAVAKKEAPAIKKNLKQGGLLSHLQPLSNEEKEKAEKKAAAEAKKGSPKTTKVQPRMNLDNKPVKNAAAEDVWMSVAKEESATASDTLAATKSKRPTSIAAAFGSDFENDDDDDLPAARPAAARGRRAAATKPTKYALSGSDSDSDGNFDVGKMVRGVPTTASSDEVRPLFSDRASMSRPGSSHGLLKKSIGGNDKRSNGFDTEADDTDYAQLAPSMAKKTGIAVMARDTAVSDDDDNDNNGDDSDIDMFDVAPAARKAVRPVATAKAKATKPSAKQTASRPAPAAASKPAAAAKKTQSKPLTLSPAAKAYAKKQGKARAVPPPPPPPPKMASFDADGSEDGDAVEKVANDILDDDDDDEEEEVVVSKRPARRAVVAAKAKPVYTVDSDDDDEDAFDDDGEEDEEESEAAVDEDDESF